MNMMPVAHTDLEQKIDGTINDSFNQEGLTGQVQKLGKNAKMACQAISEIGNESYQKLIGTKAGGEGSLFDYVVNYHWADQAKHFMILWRDSIFQLQKAQIVALEGAANEDQLTALHLQTKALLKEAARDLASTLEIETRKIRESKQGADQSVAKWKLQSNPWPIYKKQLELVAAQCAGLLTDLKFNLKASSAFSAISSLINHTLQSCLAETQEIKRLVRKAIKMIDEELSAGESKNAGGIAGKLENIEARTMLVPHLNDFLTALETKLDSLASKSQIAIQPDGGMMVQRELDLRKSVQQWLESEILPLLYEVWELTESASHGARMTFMNLRNKVIFLTTENKDGKQINFSATDLTQPLQGFVKRLSDYNSSLVQLELIANQRLEEHFSYASVFNENQAFLPLPAQYSIAPVAFGHNALVSKFLKWVYGRVEHFRDYVKSVEKEEALSGPEKVVRYINDRTRNDDNSHYSGIFLTKGFVGESFAHGRHKELEHARNIIEDWSRGFRGAILLTGQRFSGKTLLAELIAYRHFPENTIRPVPGATLDLDGRKLELGHDLSEALGFIRKNTLNERQLILMDDLELWWEPNIPIFKNLKALSDFIDAYSSSHFFIVTISNCLKSHLGRFVEMDRIFQAELNLDRIAFEDLHDAIMVRHGATHKTLVNEKDEEYTHHEISKIIRNIHRASKGNIGEALYAWTYSTQKLDKDRVGNLFSEPSSFPDFLNVDTALLLASIFMQKRTNEYRLRKLFGPAFNNKYLSIVRRMVSIGVLQRQMDGWLEINEVLVNDLGRLLHRKNYINYIY